MSSRRSRVALVLALAAAGCALGDGRRTDDAGGGRTDAGRDAAATDAGTRADDAGRGDAGELAPDAGRSDAGEVGDAGFDAGATGSPLDPRLAVPDPSGAPCTTPGSMGECPGITVCRFYTSTEGRCESCTGCGNLNDPCSANEDCDILFMCFSGRCTNFCPLGTFACGPVDDCIDIGHPTHGVCRPF